MQNELAWARPTSSAFPVSFNIYFIIWPLTFRRFQWSFTCIIFLNEEEKLIVFTRLPTLLRLEYSERHIDLVSSVAIIIF